jgi:small GTP-binding protein
MDDVAMDTAVQRVIKIIVVGDMGTGKTCIIRKFVESKFSEFYRTTIGVDFANKVVQWNETTTVDVQLWDIAGQERFGSMTSVYYREAVGALVVFDMTRGSTRETVQEWKKDIDDKVRTSLGEPVPTLLIGNKIDLLTKLENWEQTRIEIEEFVRANHFLQFFETSAKDGTNVTESFMCLVDHIMKNNIESESARDPVSMNIGAGDWAVADSGKCC